MSTPHKHAELIKAWADGAEIQFMIHPRRGWENYRNPKETTPSWHLDEVEFRIKPKELKYRVALMRSFYDGKSCDYVTRSVSSDEGEYMLNHHAMFVKWLTDWIYVPCP